MHQAAFPFEFSIKPVSFFEQGCGVVRQPGCGWFGVGREDNVNMIYTHVINSGDKGARSPADF